MRVNRRIVAVVFAVLILFGPSRAAAEEFAGLNFGVGMSLTIDTGSNDRVESAELDQNGVVRASKVTNDVPRSCSNRITFSRETMTSRANPGAGGPSWPFSPERTKPSTPSDWG